MAPDAAPDERWRLLGPALAFWVMVLAAWLRATNFVGICRLDMFRYLELSNHVLLGGSLFDESVFYASSRLPMIGPLIASNAILGWGEWASVLWPFMCSLGTVLVVMLLGRELWGWPTGLIAGLFASVMTSQVELGTQLLPDPIQGFFTVLAVYCAVRAITVDEGWRRWAIGAGFALGLAYLTRVNAIVFLPGILVVGAILDRSRWRRSLWALAGLAGALATAAAIFWALSGDPFIDWRRTAEFYADYQQTGFFEREESFFELMRTSPSLRWVLPLLAIGTVYALIDRKGRSVLMLVWAFGFWFYLDVVSGWHGLDNSYRYVEPLVAPALLLAAAGLATVTRPPARVWRRTLVALALVAVLLSMNSLTPGVVERFRGNTRWMAVRHVSEALAQHQPATVRVTSRFDLYSLNYYSGFAFERNTLEPPEAPVNERARLFLDTELSFSDEPGTYLVTTKGVDADLFEEVAAFPQQSATLRLWRRVP